MRGEAEPDFWTDPGAPVGIALADGRPVAAEVAEPLLDFLSHARWYAGKGRRAELRSVTPLPWLTEVGEWPAVRVEVVEVSYVGAEDPREAETAEGWPRELYSVPVAYRRAPVPGLQHAEIGRCTLPDLGPVVGYDAAQDPAAGRLLLRGLIDNTVRREQDNEVRFHLRDADVLHPDLEPSVFRGQQSNTSIMFGDRAMIKLFRRLELGTNLDVEVHEALSGRSEVAALYGWVDARWPYGGDIVQADLAMAVEQLADAEDGWELALQSLRQGREFAGDAKRLGRALAEIHTALGASFSTARQPGAVAATIMKQRLSAAVDVAPALEPYLPGLVACFDALTGVELPTQRVHGDFHLGQTLRTPAGWKLVDFEGEPAKTRAERAAPDSVWRDLAGMLRSFDYAAASVPDLESSQWTRDCRAAFLSGYAGGPLTAEDAAVLRAYEADKAVYEVVYETRNRPDWVGIPLAAVAAIAGVAPRSPERAGDSRGVTPPAEKREFP